MNYTWKTVYGDQRLYDLARQLRGESADSEQKEEVNEDVDYSGDDDDADDYEFVNEEYDDDEEEDVSSSEEEEIKDSKYSEIWNEKYKQLQEYKAENGHCNVPQQYEQNKALGPWVNSQRQQYRKMSEGTHSNMTDERVEKLESIGFVWAPKKDTWMERYEELKAYKAELGHCNVPTKNYESNKALGRWVNKQRIQYRRMLVEGSKTHMTEEQIEKLESIGFEWNRSKDTWKERYEQLKRFKAQNGHCNVSRNDESNKALGLWVHSQRQQYRKMSEGLSSPMTDERVEQLERIGFVWTPTEDMWNERFEELKEYEAEHRHCNVPERYEANRVLGKWVSHQRDQYRLLKEGVKSRMTEDRVEKLESIGFQWSILKDMWNGRFEELKAYKAEHGHCNVPSKYEPNKSLGPWVNTQRIQYRRMLVEGSKTPMTEERIEKLESIGFEWNRSKDTWKERYEQLKRFKAQNGHCNVHYHYKSNEALGHWVHRQRAHYKLMLDGSKSSMTDERVAKLESIGFLWVLKSKNTWNERLEELKEYKAQHRHCNVPCKYEPNKALGMWVSAQRQEYNLMSKGLKSSMTDERVEKLEHIGFAWRILSKRTSRKNATVKRRSKRHKSKK